jgi:hypothetical protein
MVIWYISTRFGMLHQQKSGNPARQLSIVAQSWCYVAIQIPDRQNVDKMKEKCRQNEKKMSTK